VTVLVSDSNTEHRWDCEATLSCGCNIHLGRLTADEANRACPRRKDHTFGALRCRHGRRRVVVYRSVWVYE
jgi:hypothetical protein